MWIRGVDKAIPTVHTGIIESVGLSAIKKEQ